MPDQLLRMLNQPGLLAVSVSSNRSLDKGAGWVHCAFSNLPVHHLRSEARLPIRYALMCLDVIWLADLFPVITSTLLQYSCSQRLLSPRTSQQGRESDVSWIAFHHTVWNTKKVFKKPKKHPILIMICIQQMKYAGLAHLPCWTDNKLYLEHCHLSPRIIPHPMSWKETGLVGCRKPNALG